MNRRRPMKYKDIMSLIVEGELKVCSRLESIWWASWKVDGEEFFIYAKEAY